MIIRPPSLRDRMLLPEDPFLSRRRRRAPSRRPLEFLLNPYRFGATVLSNAPWFEIATWTGNGSGNHTHTGIDLSNGGLVWVTARNAGVDNTLYFKASSGATVYSFSTCNTSAAVSGGGGATLDSTGFTVPLNVNARTYVAWVFKKTAGEFDIVTWTGTGAAHTVAHSLGVAPKMLFTAGLTGSVITYMQHQSVSAANYMRLFATAEPVAGSTVWNNTAATSSVFTLGTSTLVNANTVPFAAFLFAGQYFAAGAFTGTGASLNVSGIGFTPQFLVMGMPGGNWGEFDTTRTPAYTGNDAVLLGNLPATESTSSDTLASIAGGVSVAGGNFNSNGLITLYWGVK